jgi:hypothetical protein
MLHFVWIYFSVPCLFELPKLKHSTDLTAEVIYCPKLDELMWLQPHILPLGAVYQAKRDFIYSWFLECSTSYGL